MSEYDEMTDYEMERLHYEENLAEVGMGYATEGFSGAEAMELARRWVGPPPTNPEPEPASRAPHFSETDQDDDVPY